MLPQGWPETTLPARGLNVLQSPHLPSAGEGAQHPARPSTLLSPAPCSAQPLAPGAAHGTGDHPTSIRNAASRTGAPGARSFIGVERSWGKARLFRASCPRRQPGGGGGSAASSILEAAAGTCPAGPRRERRCNRLTRCRCRRDCAAAPASRRASGCRAPSRG